MPFQEGEEIEGYNSFMEKIKILEVDKEKTPLYILFTGSEGEDGKSWCPDCVQFEEMWSTLRSTHSPEQGSLIRVKVGGRDYWKDKACPFRTDKKIQLSSVPTLIKWGTPKRLSEDSIQNLENVKMLFEDDD